jgi:hypothetical protein
MAGIIQRGAAFDFLPRSCECPPLVDREPAFDDPIRDLREARLDCAKTSSSRTELSCDSESWMSARADSLLPAVGSSSRKPRSPSLGAAADVSSRRFVGRCFCHGLIDRSRFGRGLNGSRRRRGGRGNLDHSTALGAFDLAACKLLAELVFSLARRTLADDGHRSLSVRVSTGGKPLHYRPLRPATQDAYME